MTNVDCLLVNFSGDILSIPVADFVNPQKLRWWTQLPRSGDNPKLEARSRIAWARYAALTGQEFYRGSMELKRNRFQLWLRHQLTRMNII